MLNHSNSQIRLQKLLAERGLGSRRQIEQWLREGRIRVNGRLAQLGDRASLSDKVAVDGRIVRMSARQAPPSTKVLLYHKPTGEVCTRQDEHNRPTIFDSLPSIHNARWINVGRLDLNTSGLLLLSNDGDLVHRLTHPSSQIEREYAVRVLGEVTAAQIERLTRGILLEDGKARFTSLRPAGGEGANHWYHVTVKEGRNRLVRRLWEAENITVSRLIRVRFGPLSLPPYLRVGQHRLLKDAEIKALQTAVSPKPS